MSNTVLFHPLQALGKPQDTWSWRFRVHLGLLQAPFRAFLPLESLNQPEMGQKYWNKREIIHSLTQIASPVTRPCHIRPDQTDKIRQCRVWKMRFSWKIRRRFLGYDVSYFSQPTAALLSKPKCWGLTWSTLNQLRHGHYTLTHFDLRCAALSFRCSMLFGRSVLVRLGPRTSCLRCYSDYIAPLRDPEIKYTSVSEVLLVFMPFIFNYSILLTTNGWILSVERNFKRWILQTGR